MSAFDDGLVDLVDHGEHEDGVAAEFAEVGVVVDEMGFYLQGVGPDAGNGSGDLVAVQARGAAGRGVAGRGVARRGAGEGVRQLAGVGFAVGGTGDAGDGEDHGRDHVPGQPPGQELLQGGRGGCG